MNSAHLHLLLNHIPIIGLFAVIVMLLFALWKSNVQMLNFSMAALVVISLLSIPLEETGEAAEDVVENTTTVDEAYIKEHEKAADYATPLMYATGAVALLGLFFSRGKNNLPSWLKTLLVAVALFTQVVMIRTGYLGGKIRRPELQGTSTAQPAGEKAGEEEDD